MDQIISAITKDLLQLLDDAIIKVRVFVFVKLVFPLFEYQYQRKSGWIYLQESQTHLESHDGDLKTGYHGHHRFFPAIQMLIQFLLNRIRVFFQDLKDKP